MTKAVMTKAAMSKAIVSLALISLSLGVLTPANADAQSPQPAAPAAPTTALSGYMELHFNKHEFGMARSTSTVSSCS